jgi:hypothetical protein
MPRPARARLSDAVVRDAACAECHPREASEWRTSRHHEAATNGAFRDAHAIEPERFCRRCHAPEADPDRPPPAAVEALGIGCVTCHLLDDGAVLAAAREDASLPADAQPVEDPRALAAHPIRRSVDFAHEGACAGCHEFRFPGAVGDADADFMQTTVREHLRARKRDTPCAGCHMPRVEGRRSHAFTQVRDPAWLRARLSVEATRARDGELRITLTPKAPGHAFPTGDLFRRVEIVAERRTPDGRTARDARHLGRHFVLVPGQPRRTLTHDDRIFDGPVTVDLALPPGGAITWWVRLQRPATVGVGDDPDEARIESEVELAKGTLP